MAKIYLRKVKRKSVDWYAAMRAIEDDNLRTECYKVFYYLMKKHPDMSFKRRAFYALKRNVSTTALSYYSCTGRWFVI